LHFLIGSATPVTKTNQAPRTVVKSTKLQPKNCTQLDSGANSNPDYDYYAFEHPRLLGNDENVPSADIISDNVPYSPSGVTGAAGISLMGSP